MKKLKIISIPNNTIWYATLLGESILWNGKFIDCDHHGFHPEITIESLNARQKAKLDSDVVRHLYQAKEDPSFGVEYFINVTNVLEYTDENILAIIISDLEREIK